MFWTTRWWMSSPKAFVFMVVAFVVYHVYTSKVYIKFRFTNSLDDNRQLK